MALLRNANGIGFLSCLGLPFTTMQSFMWLDILQFGTFHHAGLCSDECNCDGGSALHGWNSCNLLHLPSDLWLICWGFSCAMMGRVTCMQRCRNATCAHMQHAVPHPGRAHLVRCCSCICAGSHGVPDSREALGVLPELHVPQHPLDHGQVLLRRRLQPKVLPGQPAPSKMPSLQALATIC